MTAQNSQTGKDNTQNMAMVREAMANEQLKTVADQVQLGGELSNVLPIHYVASSGKLYEGNVVVKRPTTKDLMRIGGLKAQYFRDAGVEDLMLLDASVRFLAHVLAHLKVVVVQSPPWLFNVDTIEDTDVIYEVYAKFAKWDDSFRKGVSGTEKATSEPSEGTETLGS